jgi:hypothetical protein
VDTSIFSRALVTLHTAVYFKAKNDAPVSELSVSDPRFNDTEGFLGWALDVSWSWRIVSDLSFVLACGVFKPGAAYTERKLDYLLQTTLVFSL